MSPAFLWSSTANVVMLSRVREKQNESARAVVIKGVGKISRIEYFYDEV